MNPPFCGEYDRVLEQEGPASIFLLDREGTLRFDETWTRDCWGRRPVERMPGAWFLVRDMGSGFVHPVYATGDLLKDHPRLQVRRVGDWAAVQAALRDLGSPAVETTPWS